MKQWSPVVIAIGATAAAVVFAVLYFTKDIESEPVAAQQCGDRLYGHISSLTPHADHYLLHFDPAFITSGLTANTAAAEDGAVEPGQPVPNDNYVIDESDRKLTYLVGPNAHVTVLTKQGDPANFGAAPITVSELAKIVKGTSTLDLFEPLDSGVWIRYQNDTVCALDQQYKP